MEKENKLPSLSDRLLMCYQVFESVRHLEVCFDFSHILNNTTFRKSAIVTATSSQTTSLSKKLPTGLRLFFSVTGDAQLINLSLRTKSRLAVTT